MQPHANLGINFRRRFTISYGKKKELDKIRSEEERVHKAYINKKIPRETALSRLYNLATQFLRIKESK